MPQFKTNWPIARKTNSLYSTIVARGSHKVWLTGDENCRRSSILKFLPHMVLCWKQISIECLIFIAYISPWLWYFIWSFVEIWWKLLREQSFENRRIWHFVKCTGWPQIKLKAWSLKSTLHISTVVPWVPNVRPFRSTISHFGDIPNFRFPSDSHGKISKCHKMFLFFLAGRQNIHSLYSRVLPSIS